MTDTASRGDDLKAWNYRVLDDGQVHRIIEVYYDADGVIASWCDAGEARGDDMRDLLGEIKLRHEAVERAQLKSVGVLTPDDLSGEWPA